MTPELRTSCELVFQEHKSSNLITWNKDTFRERMSIGLSEMAKATLLQKNVIYFPKPTKKTITVLNPDLVSANSFEEAVEMAKSKIKAPVLVTDSHEEEEEPAYVPAPVSRVIRYSEKNKISSSQPKQTAETATVPMVREQWHLKPVFYYIIWPLTAAIVSVLIAWLMSQCVEMAYR